jgi:hypothetical protein
MNNESQRVQSIVGLVVDDFLMVVEINESLATDDCRLAKNLKCV